MKFYENDIVKSYDCFIIDDNTIRINISENSNEIGCVFLKEDQLKELLDNEYFYIDSMKIKKPFIKSLEVLLD
jgi:hypothetical protein